MSEIICTICLDRLVGSRDEFLEEQPAVVMKKCGHTFHGSCAEKAITAGQKTDARHAGEDYLWNSYCPQCPICKAVMDDCIQGYCNDTAEHFSDDMYTKLYFAGDEGANLSAIHSVPIGEDAKKRFNMAKTLQRFGMDIRDAVKTAQDYGDASGDEDSDDDDYGSDGHADGVVKRLHRTNRKVTLEGNALQEFLKKVVDEHSGNVLKAIIAGINASLSAIASQFALLPLLESKVSEIQQLREKRDELEDQLLSLERMQRTLVKRAAEVELEVVKSEHRIAIANLKEQHELELQNVKKEGERIVTKLKRDMQKEIETAKQAAAGYLDERDENRRRLDAVEARNDQLEKQLNQSQSDNDILKQNGDRQAQQLEDSKRRLMTETNAKHQIQNECDVQKLAVKELQEKIVTLTGPQQKIRELEDKTADLTRRNGRLLQISQSFTQMMEKALAQDALGVAEDGKDWRDCRLSEEHVDAAVTAPASPLLDGTTLWSGSNRILVFPPPAAFDLKRKRAEDEELSFEENRYLDRIKRAHLDDIKRANLNYIKRAKATGASVSPADKPSLDSLVPAAPIALDHDRAEGTLEPPSRILRC